MSQKKKGKRHANSKEHGGKQEILVDDHQTEKVKREMKKFESTLRSFLSYQLYSNEWLARFQLNSQKLLNQRKEEIYTQALELMESKISELRKASKKNMEFIKLMLAEHLKESKVVASETSTNEMSMEHVKNSLIQFAREWSADGALERTRCFSPILEQLQSKYPLLEERKKVEIMCPGCGLGRLPWEIAKLGFACQGNEYDYFMLLPAQFVLNRVSQINQFEMHPFIHQTTNQLSTSNQLRVVKIPDVNPSDLPKDSKFSMTAGNFLEVYNSKEYKGTFDCVVTSFFMDTAKNIVDYIHLIHSILKLQGMWINFGPLLYHFADMKEEVAIEFSLEEVKKLILCEGFEIQTESLVDSLYTTDEKSMLHYLYKCSFFTAVKVK